MINVTVHITPDSCDDNYYYFKGQASFPDFDEERFGVPRSEVPDESAAKAFAAGWNMHRKNTAEQVFARIVNSAGR